MPRERRIESDRATALVPHAPLIVARRGEHSLVSLELPDALPFEQWAAIGGELGMAEHAVAWWIGDWWAFGEERYGLRKAVVESHEWKGPAFQTCVNCSNVAKKFATNRRRLVVSFTHHAEVTSLDSVLADALLDRAEAEGLSAMQLRALVRELRAAKRIGNLSAEPLPVDAPVHVLYLDPPWRYENPPMGGGNRSIENHYPTMTIDELKALDVGGCALDDALIFMWATVPKLAECLELFEPWRFTYRTNLCWDKVDIGMGYYARNAHELLLIGKRGELPPPVTELRPGSVHHERPTEHSAKPAYYADLIEQWYPTLRKRELFSRDPTRPGWLPSWGNQQIKLVAA